MITPRPFGRAAALALLAAVVLLAALPLLLLPGASFGGADGAAQAAIGQIAPDYQPWAAPLARPPGAETEGLLFALQAALGAGLIGYFFGLKRGQRMRAEPPPGDLREQG